MPFNPCSHAGNVGEGRLDPYYVFLTLKDTEGGWSRINKTQIMPFNPYRYVGNGGRVNGPTLYL